MKYDANATRSGGMKIPISHDFHCEQPQNAPPIIVDAGERVASSVVLLCLALPARSSKRQRAQAPENNADKKKRKENDKGAKNFFRRILDDCDLNFRKPGPAMMMDQIHQPWMLPRILHCNCSPGCG